MIQRQLLPLLVTALEESPAVCLLGPRQVGKTTLALEVAAQRSALYLDLESEEDRAKLPEPAPYLSRHPDKLVILDEVHRAPDLFPALRGLIDQARRQGAGRGRYLLLGSASLALLRPSGESLAGRMRFLELTRSSKRSMAPRAERGFHAACADVRPMRRFVVYPGAERFPLGQEVEAIPLAELVRTLQANSA